LGEIYEGASTVKWATLDPYLVLSESDSILSTGFEFCEEKNHRQFKKLLIYKAKHFMMKTKFQEMSTYFRRRCKWCASR
jgi:hypothetical protein